MGLLSLGFSSGMEYRHDGWTNLDLFFMKAGAYRLGVLFHSSANLWPVAIATDSFMFSHSGEAPYNFSYTSKDSISLLLFVMPNIHFSCSLLLIPTIVDVAEFLLIFIVWLGDDVLLPMAMSTSLLLSGDPWWLVIFLVCL